MTKAILVLALLVMRSGFGSMDVQEGVQYSQARTHLALPVENIKRVRNFYQNVFNATVHKGTPPPMVKQCMLWK